MTTLDERIKALEALGKRYRATEHHTLGECLAVIRQLKAERDALKILLDRFEYDEYVSDVIRESQS